MFESSLERDFLVLLDFVPCVEQVEEQPVAITYCGQNGESRRYTPDTRVVFNDGQPTSIFEVKYREDLRTQWAASKLKFRAAMRYCQERGWRFRIITDREIRGSALLANAKFLRAYREREPDAGVEEHLVRTLATLGEVSPDGLIKAAYWNQDWRMRAVSALWRLVAIGRIEADLYHPLTMVSPIWVCVGEGFVWRQHPILCR